MIQHMNSIFSALITESSPNKDLLLHVCFGVWETLPSPLHHMKRRLCSFTFDLAVVLVHLHPNLGDLQNSSTVFTCCKRWGRTLHTANILCRITAVVAVKGSGHLPLLEPTLAAIENSPSCRARDSESETFAFFLLPTPLGLQKRSSFFLSQEKKEGGAGEWCWLTTLLTLSPAGARNCQTHPHHWRRNKLILWQTLRCMKQKTSQVSRASFEITGP